ncbi:MAG TPA: sulfotransferase [Verrucomicrobiota bacterium]|nr:sulfotransferase [Verrucomicrobiota bacterium]
MPLTDFQRPGLAALIRWGGGWLGPLLGHWVNLNPDDLIATARRRAQLEDFGEPDFASALRTLLTACESEAQLNLIGRLAARGDVLRVLRNRLQLERDRKLHPEIADQPIRKPIFVVGLPRSGTTFLHRLLSQDPANRVPLTWEGLLPSPPPEAATYATDPRIEFAATQVRWFLRLAPQFQRIHPVSAQFAEECVLLHSHSFVSYQFDTMYRIPSYSAWLEQQDFRDSYRVHRQLLQQLQWKCPGERWVLKAPNHLFQLRALLATYPDACLVWTHRTPLDTLASLSSLCTELRRVFSDSVEPKEVGPELSQAWAEGVRRALEVLDSGLIPPERIFHVAYSELIRDPLETVRRVYDHFGLTRSEAAAERLRSFIETNRKGRFGEHRYSLEQFGLTRADEAKRFAEYSNRFL